MDAFLALLGAYLAAALLVAAWRRAAQRSGGTGLWAALLGAWTVAVHARWQATPPGGAVAVFAAWLALAVVLIRAGGALAAKRRLHGFVWLLGPADALALAVSWIAAARARPAAEAPASEALARRDEAMESVVELGETTLAEVMVPRSEIQALPEDACVKDWAAMVRATRRSRLLLFRGDLDEIVGCVSSGDLFAAEDPLQPVRRFARAVRFVPERMRCDDLLRDLIAHGEHLAVAVDEFGGTAGLVTDEDLLEILLGEIDRDGASLGLWKLGENVYLADAGLRIDDWNECFSVRLPEGDYETISGLILAHLGRIPSPGERLEVAGVALEVAAGSARQILRVRAIVPPGSDLRGTRGDR